MRIASLADLNDHNRRVSETRAAALAKALQNSFVARHAAVAMEGMHRDLLMIQDPIARFEAFRRTNCYECVVSESDKKLSVQFAEHHNAAQRAIAKKPRKPPTDGAGIAKLVGQFSREQPAIKPLDLWPKFFEELEKRELYPIKINDGNTYKYWPFGKTDRISLGYFRSLISKARKKAAP